MKMLGYLFDLFFCVWVFFFFFGKIGEEIGANEVDADEVRVDKMGSRRSGNKPSRVNNTYMYPKKRLLFQVYLCPRVSKL